MDAGLWQSELRTLKNRQTIKIEEIEKAAKGILKRKETEMSFVNLQSNCKCNYCIHADFSRGCLKGLFLPLQLMITETDECPHYKCDNNKIPERFNVSMKEAYDNVPVSQLEHLPEQSVYCHNFYKGFKRDGNETQDLLLADSDDDNTTEWFLVTRHGERYIGYSLCSEGDIIHVDLTE